MVTNQDIMNKIFKSIINDHQQDLVTKGPFIKRGKLVLNVTIGDQVFDIIVKEKKEQ